jgi:hypothetical protein
MSDHENNISLKQQHIKTKERTAKPAWIPQAFFELLNLHINSAKEIEEYWRNVYALTCRMELPPDLKEEIAIASFKEMKTRRRSIHNPIGYFTGVVKRKAKQQWISLRFNELTMEY